MADTPSNPYGSPEDKPVTPSTSGGAVPPPPPPHNPYAAPQPVSPMPKDNAQTFGIIGIVLDVLCCPPIGALFGWLSMKEAKKVGKDDTLGKVAFWLGVAATALWLVSAIALCALGGLGTFTDNNRY